MIIAGVEVGTGQPCRVAAEISNNHNGSLPACLQLITDCHDVGVDFVKLQAYLPQELVALRGDGPAPEPWGSDGWTMEGLYAKAQTPLAWFPQITEHLKKLDQPWFCSVFGLGSLAFLEACGCPAYKLAALDYSKRSQRQMLEKVGKPIVRSCPNDMRPKYDGLVLWCPPGYPQSVDGLPLATMMKRFDGFSYHGTAAFVPALAAAYGAQLVECHVQSDTEPSELEADVSLTVSQLAELVECVRTVGRLAA